MNDRFKFRVWDKNEKTYSVIPYGNYAWSDSGELFLIESNCDCSELNIECFIIEQYTGLKDRNGKLIYENDFVLLNGEIWQVIWSEEDCAFFLSSLKETYHQPIYPDLYNHARDFEVVGNVHETQEILKEIET